MRKGMAAIALVLGLAINLLTAQLAAAQTPPSADGAEQSPRSRAKQAREAMRAMAAFSGAASTYTEIVELTLAERSDAVRFRIAAARGDLARIRPMLADDAFELEFGGTIIVLALPQGVVAIESNPADPAHCITPRP